MTPEPTLSAGDATELRVGQVWRASDGSERRIVGELPNGVHWSRPGNAVRYRATLNEFRTWIRRTNAVRVEQGR